MKIFVKRDCSSVLAWEPNIFLCWCLRKKNKHTTICLVYNYGNCSRGFIFLSYHSMLVSLPLQKLFMTEIWSRLLPLYYLLGGNVKHAWQNSDHKFLEIWHDLWTRKKTKQKRKKSLENHTIWFSLISIHIQYYTNVIQSKIYIYEYIWKV